MVYTKEEFKRLWEANKYGSGITYDDIADCAKAWGISSDPRTRHIDEIAYSVLKAADVSDAEEYNPDPTPKKREEIGCGWCVNEETCEKRKNRTITTRELARACGEFVHYKEAENRRFDIAKRCLAALAPCAVPGRMGEREVNPAVAARTAIELADELIKQMKGDK